MTLKDDVDLFRSKIGLERSCDDVLTLRAAQAFQATFDDDVRAVREGGAAPPGIHSCLHTPYCVPTRDLMPDGSDDDGGEFRSPAALPRRMRAGGGLRFYQPLRIGATITRKDRVVGVELKQGRHGPLCFVTVQRDYHCDGALAMTERIDSVYRTPASDTDKPAQTKPAAQPPAAADGGQPLVLSLALLMRYSAMTFNAHRIHFDEHYAQSVEGYDGLVVHGPLQATLLLRCAVAAAGGVMPESLEYRATKPLILGDAARVVTQRSGDRIELAIVGGDGLATMNAMARLRQ